MIKQSLWIVSQTLRALMRSGSWKILTLLPVAVFASSAFGTIIGPAPGAAISWEVLAKQNGIPAVSGGYISAEGNPNSWNALVGGGKVATFTNPSGLGIAKVGVYPLPFIDAAASSLAPSPPHTNDTGVYIDLVYYLEVDGGPPFDVLPLMYTIDYTLSGAPSELNMVSGPDGFIRTCAGGCRSGYVYAVAHIQSNRTFEVNIAATAYSQYSENGGFTSVAYIDPYFYLSPAEVAAGYSLVFSDTVGNAPPGPVSGSAVPEPASLMLFGAGVIAAGIPMRRRSARP